MIACATLCKTLYLPWIILKILRQCHLGKYCFSIVYILHVIYTYLYIFTFHTNEDYSLDGSIGKMSSHVPHPNKTLDNASASSSVTLHVPLNISGTHDRSKKWHWPRLVPLHAAQKHSTTLHLIFFTCQPQHLFIPIYLLLFAHSSYFARQCVIVGKFHDASSFSKFAISFRENVIWWKTLCYAYVKFHDASSFSKFASLFSWKCYMVKRMIFHVFYPKKILVLLQLTREKK